MSEILFYDRSQMSMNFGLFKNLISNQRGASIITTVLAAATIIGSIVGTIAASMYLNTSLKKSEATNLAVMVESNLISAFNNKNNYPEDSVASKLRPGTTDPLNTLPLVTSFGTINVNIQSGPVLTDGTIGYLTRDLSVCSPDFSNKSCYLKYEVRLKKNLVGGNLYSYSFSYQIDANPNIVKMASLGNRSAFDVAIDPGNYRSDYNLTICDPSADLFMNGYNRDSGESFCIEKPKLAKCPDQRLPKGLSFAKYTGQAKAGSVELVCTASPMRTYSCPPNYSLSSFDPRYADPDFPKANLNPSNVIGQCVFRTRTESTIPSNFPANPTMPYIRQIAGTVCPPYYKVKSGAAGCNLVPNTSRNSTYGAGSGMGRCADTFYGDCKRDTYTDTPNYAPYNAWSICNSTPPTMLPPPAPVGTPDTTKPPFSCGPAPANPVYTRTCSFTENSHSCNGVADVPTTCSTVGSWSAGTTPYAVNVKDMPPSASVNVTTSGRDIKCWFVDDQKKCNAPDTLLNGSTYGKKDPKWYGGVQLSGTVCVFDPSQGAAEKLDAF